MTPDTFRREGIAHRVFMSHLCRFPYGTFRPAGRPLARLDHGMTYGPATKEDTMGD